MKKGSISILALVTLVVGVVSILGQAGPPPQVLLVVREDIKTGKMPAHTAEANGVVQIWSKARSPYHRLAMVPVAGNENEVTYLWPFDSFAALEKSIDDLDRIATVTHKADFDRIQNRGEDYHSLQRDTIAVLREDLSYNTNADMPRMRFMRMQTVRVRPNQARAFEEGRRILKAAHEKAKIDENMIVYQVVGGMQTGTYLVFIPWRSLEGLGTIPHDKAYWDAMGSDNRSKLEKINDSAVVYEDVNIYAFSPQLSYVSPRFVAADPGFWTFKPMASPVSEVAVKRATARRARQK